MPIVPTTPNYLNVPQAIQQGNALAMDQAQMQALGQQMQQRNALAPMQQEQMSLQTDAAKHDYMIRNLNMASPENYGAIRQDLIGKGMPAKNLPESFDPDYLNAVLGRKAEKTESFGDMVSIPGATGYVGQRSSTGKYVNIKEGMQEAVQAEGTGSEIDLTPGQKKLDETFAKDYSEYVAAGGYADVDKQLNQLREVKRMLDVSSGLVKPEKGEKAYNLTGPMLGLLPESIQARTYPEAVAAKNAVEEVVQRNLRLVLGAQFTEKEGERLIARAYNPALDEKENAKRVGRLIGQIAQAAKAKQRASDYFEKNNGTLKGFKGKLWTPADFGMSPAQENWSSAQQPMQAQTGQPQDQQAIEWATQNPNDPRAQQILQMNGIQ